ncbi:hypothetical protein [Bacillus cereus]|nr:hypothetical protein [Bacillus cereus]
MRRRYREANKEYIAAQLKEYYAKNKERLQEHRRKYYKENKERENTGKLKEQRNAEEIAAYKNNGRKRMRSA